MAKRIAFIVNALTGDELTGGDQDTARVFSLLTRSDLGDCDPSLSVRMHQCATYSALVSGLRETLSNWKYDDQLVFYFSGHGAQRGGQYCLLFGRQLEEFVTFQSILADLDVKRVSRAIIILDSCHSGAALRSGEKTVIQEPHFAEQDIPKGIAILASCQLSEKSYELNDGSVSLFTHLFCEGIETGLAGSPTEDNLINVGDIVGYVNERLHSDQDYAAIAQSPSYEVHGATRNIWISKNLSPKAEAKGKAFLHNVLSVDDLRLAYETTATSRHPCAGAELSDLNWKLVEQYAFAADLRRSISNNRQNFAADLGLFSPLSPTGKNTLHNAAVLCFCDHPETWIPQATATFVVGSLDKPTFKLDTVSGTLGFQIDRLVSLTVEWLQKTSSHNSDLDIPESLVRELVSNAVAHRDYNSHGNVQVMVMAESLGVQSPGEFPKGTSWETFFQSGHVSCPVDPAIGLYLKRLLALEGVGHGFSVFRDYVVTNGKDSLTCELLTGPTTLVRVKRRAATRSKSKESRDRQKLTPSEFDEVVEQSLEEEWGDLEDATKLLERFPKPRITPQSALEKFELRLAIRGAIDSLPETQRVVILQILENFERGEQINAHRMADELGVPYATFHARFARAMMALQKVLNEIPIVHEWKDSHRTSKGS